MQLPARRAHLARHARSRGRRSVARRVATSIICPVAAVLIVLAAFGAVGGRPGVTRLLGLADAGVVGPAPTAAVSTARPPAPIGMAPHRTEARGSSRASTARWRAVLHRLDRARARAWRRADPELLRAVYTPRATALGADRHLLAAYARRGLRVHGVHLAIGRLQVTGRRPRYVRLRVVDRLANVTALSSSGRTLRLPRDLPTRHRIVLRRCHGVWRIDAVTVV